MALFSGRSCVLSALLVLVCSAAWARAEQPDDADGIAVETEVEEEDEYRSPVIDPHYAHFAEHFDDVDAFNKRWVRSEAKKQGVDEDIAKYDGVWEIQEPVKPLLKNDLGLVLTTEAKHAAISAMLDRPFEFKDKPLVVQYEVTMQEGQVCGGAYLKLLSRGAELRRFHDQTPYTVMFGPDKCGNDVKLHFIFRHQNPNNGSIEEKHSKKPSSERLDEVFKDKRPHLYTLVVRPDNSFSVRLDGREVSAGSLLADVAPPVNPPAEVDDPHDTRPHDWDEREKIVDPTAHKPDDWDESEPAQIPDPNAVKPDGWLDDEPLMIPDPTARKPADWDEDIDGEWEAPLVDNPACGAAPGCGPWAAPLVPNPDYKGPWRAPLVTNPNYRGKWTPRRIPNPDYFRDDHPFQMTPVTAVGFELWSMSGRLLFDNLLVTDDEAAAADWAARTIALKQARLHRDSRSLSGRVSRALGGRAGWWALYALYVAAPVALYVRYLLSRAGQDSVWDRALRYAGANPWVYVAAILAIFLLVGLVVFLCTGSKDSDADRKKTDAFAEDDQPSEGEGEGEAAEGEGEGEPEREAGEKQGEVEGEEPREAGGEEPREEPKPAKSGKAQLEPQDAAPPAADTAPLMDSDGGGDHQRRRKPRRE